MITLYKIPVTCNNCQQVYTVSETIQAGEIVECPSCGHRMQLCERIDEYGMAASRFVDCEEVYA